jgi:threonine dehydrogenase-like Zn-dependent dehydrogenase
MKAAVYRGNQRLEIEDIPKPEPGPGQVLVKVKYCAICGSDVHRFQHDMLNPGVVLGHEYCGTIAETGVGVNSRHVGDRVVGGGGTPPPGNPPSLAAAPRYTARELGFTPAASWGGYAEYVLMDAWRPLPVPDSVTDETACLTEPCAISMHAIRLSHLKVGDNVAIVGAGPIGLLAQQIVNAAGAGRVYVSDPSPGRRDAALRFGADRVLDPTREDVVAELVDETSGLGPDIVLECAGGRGSLQQSLSMVRRAGQVVVVSLAWEEDPVLTVDWVGREIEMKTAYGSSPAEWQMCVRLMEQGKIVSGAMVPEESIVPLDDIQAAFESLIRPQHQVQIVIAP